MTKQSQFSFRNIPLTFYTATFYHSSSVKHLCMCSVQCRHDFCEDWATASPPFHTPLPLQVKNQVQVQTFASSTFSSFLDVLLSCFVFLALTLACFLPPLVSPATVGHPAPAALALAPLAGLLELASLVLSIRWVLSARTCFATEFNKYGFERTVRRYLYMIIHSWKKLLQNKTRRTLLRPICFPGGMENLVKCHVGCYCQCCAIRAQEYLAICFQIDCCSAWLD